MPQMKRETRIKREKKRLESLFAGLDETKRSVLDGMITEAAYHRIMVEDLREDILENGMTEMFQQSDKVEPYERIRPKAQQYTTMLNVYQRDIKLLASNLPDDASKDSAAELMEFLNR